MKEDFWLLKWCYRNFLNIRWHRKVTNDSIRHQLNKQKTIILSSAPSDIKSWHWAYLLHAGQSTTKECAIWLYGKSTMPRNTAKAGVGQHHWVDWSEYRRCCENDTKLWCLEKLRIWPQRSTTMRHDDDDDEQRSALSMFIFYNYVNCNKLNYDDNQDNHGVFGD